MITKRQKEILEFITDYREAQGFSPSLDEVRQYFGLSSVSTVHQHVKALERKGYLKRLENKARSIQIGPGEGLVEIPLLGEISAGQPLEHYPDPESIAVPQNILPKQHDDCYALKVRGDSMIRDGIADGDTVIVKHQDVAQNGDNVVALINNAETTLKKFYSQGSKVILKPRNPELKSITLAARDVVVQGRVVGVFRKLEEEEKIEFQWNRIVCGDVLDVMQTIPDNSIHLAITSPPYNVGKNYDNHNDKMDYQEYLDWLIKVWQETKRVLVPGGRFALNIAPTGIKDFVPIHHDFTNQLRKIDLKFRTEIVWYKQTMLKRTAWGSFKSPANPHIVPSWEYVLIFSKGKDRLDGDNKMADISKEEFMKFSDGFWQIWPETQRKGHPSPFPEKLIYRLIKFYSYKGNNVLDMFGGTGTVAVVAAKTGRNFLHIDISPQYCKIAKDRVDEELKQGRLT